MARKSAANNQESRYTATWNDSGVDYKAIELDVTDTASGVDSSFVKLKKDGTEVFDMRKDGRFRTVGDIDLDGGGTTYSTILQLVTPTANRSISFPDATGIIALVSGANGAIQFNQLGKLKGTDNFSVALEWDSSTTTYYGLKLNVTDTASAAESSLMDLQISGSSHFKVEKDGSLQQGVLTVSDLPAATAGNAGTRTFVSDSNAAAASNFGAVVAGGGSNTVPVYSDGGAWRIG